MEARIVTLEWRQRVERYLESKTWEVRRFCQEDWILNIRVFRVVRREKLEVALFLAEDHYKFIKDAGVMGGLVFLLSEAYNQLGKMEIRFIGPPEGHEPEVPACIRRVAANLRVSIQGRTSISDAEGRQMYARLTGLSSEVERILAERHIDLIRACFIVQRRVWGALEVEYILKHAFSPERIFDGGVGPEHRLSFQHDLLVLRLALTSERTRTFLQNLAEREGSAVISAKWQSETEQEVVVNQPVTLSSTSGSTVYIPRNTPLAVSLCPYNAVAYARRFPADIQRLGHSHPESSWFIAVTQDFNHVPKGVRDRSLNAIGRTGIIIPIVDTIGDLDEEITKRLARAFSTSRAMPELPD